MHGWERGPESVPNNGWSSASRTVTICVGGRSVLIPCITERKDGIRKIDKKAISSLWLLRDRLERKDLSQREVKEAPTPRNSTLEGLREST